MNEAALRFVAALMAGYAVVIAALFVAALIRGWIWKQRAVATAELSPRIRAALVAYLAGNDDLTALRGLLAVSRSDVTVTMLSFQDAVAGSARDRLCALALHIGLVEEWLRAVPLKDTARRRAAFAGISFAWAYEPCRRAMGGVLLDATEDADPEVRAYAARALARFGSAAEIEKVFRMAVRSNLAMRIAVTGLLRDHALELAAGAVHEELRSDHAPRILATLQMVVAWERSLPLSGLEEFMEHRETAIRLHALRAAPLVAASREVESAVLRSLADSDLEVARTAAAVVGRMQIKESLPLLARCFRRGDAALARLAAAALIALPPQGGMLLEELAASGDAAISQTASAALAHVRGAGLLGGRIHGGHMHGGMSA